jgi:hypothetical protein
MAVMYLVRRCRLLRSHSCCCPHPLFPAPSPDTFDALLEPTDPLFQQLGTAFYKALISTYGTDGFYNADT